MKLKTMLATLAITACLQAPAYAAPRHDNLVGGTVQPAPSFTYHVVTTWESTYMDDYVYIEYKSYRVHYSTPLPYNVTISYNIYYEDGYGSSNDEHITWESQGATSTYLGYYETYYQDTNNPNAGFTRDLILNYVQ